jgi:hypothetical protein
MLRALASGLLSREDVCDAGAELARAAQSFGLSRGVACPVCAGPELREVSFAFGKGLPRDGQVLGGLVDERSLERIADVRLFRVEVCLDCRWNCVLEERSRGLC